MNDKTETMNIPDELSENVEHVTDLSQIMTEEEMARGFAKVPTDTITDEEEAPMDSDVVEPAPLNPVDTPKVEKQTFPSKEEILQELNKIERELNQNSQNLVSKKEAQKKIKEIDSRINEIEVKMSDLDNYIEFSEEEQKEYDELNQIHNNLENSINAAETSIRTYKTFIDSTKDEYKEKKKAIANSEMIISEILSFDSLPTDRKKEIVDVLNISAEDKKHYLKNIEDLDFKNVDGKDITKDVIEETKNIRKNAKNIEKELDDKNKHLNEVIEETNTEIIGLNNELKNNELDIEGFMLKTNSEETLEKRRKADEELINNYNYEKETFDKIVALDDYSPIDSFNKIKKDYSNDLINEEELNNNLNTLKKHIKNVTNNDNKDNVKDKIESMTLELNQLEVKLSDDSNYFKEYTEVEKKEQLEKFNERKMYATNKLVELEKKLENKKETELFGINEADKNLSPEEYAMKQNYIALSIKELEHEIDMTQKRISSYEKAETLYQSKDRVSTKENKAADLRRKEELKTAINVLHTLNASNENAFALSMIDELQTKLNGEQIKENVTTEVIPENEILEPVQEKSTEQEKQDIFDFYGGFYENDINEEEKSTKSNHTVVKGPELKNPEKRFKFEPEETPLDVFGVKEQPKQAITNKVAATFKNINLGLKNSIMEFYDWLKHPLRGQEYDGPTLNDNKISSRERLIMLASAAIAVLAPSVIEYISSNFNGNVPDLEDTKGTDGLTIEDGSGKTIEPTTDNGIGTYDGATGSYSGNGENSVTELPEDSSIVIDEDPNIPDDPNIPEDPNNGLDIENTTPGDNNVDIGGTLPADPDLGTQPIGAGYGDGKCWLDSEGNIFELGSDGVPSADDTYVCHINTDYVQSYTENGVTHFKLTQAGIDAGLDFDNMDLKDIMDKDYLSSHEDQINNLYNGDNTLDPIDQTPVENGNTEATPENDGNIDETPTDDEIVEETIDEDPQQSAPVETQSAPVETQSAPVETQSAPPETVIDDFNEVKSR